MEPYCPGNDLRWNFESNELDTDSLLSLLSRGADIQGRLSGIDLETRLRTVEEMGRIWSQRWESGELEDMADRLAASSGYSRALIDMEMAFTREVLNGENMRKSLEASLQGGAASLQDFVAIGEGEYVRSHATGPVLIISSGNSIVPPLIPTITSLVTGNLTILKPSRVNYEAVTEALKSWEVAAEKSGAPELKQALVVGYLAADSPGMDQLLQRGRLGAVNFWGGDPARRSVASKLASNPHLPRLFINGPLTGFAIVDGDAGEEAAAGLALNMVMYDQQLCSSPTQAAFIGSRPEAESFCRLTAQHLDRIGAESEMGISDDGAFLLQCGRRYVQFAGAKVFQSNDQKNMWTISLSEGLSDLDEAASSYAPLAFHNRRRFLEMVRVDSAEDALALVADLPMNPAFRGADRVQSVGLAVSAANRERLLAGLPATGAFRIMPVDDMFMRSPLEPYDGMQMAEIFTHRVYMRDRSIRPEVLKWRSWSPVPAVSWAPTWQRN